MKKNTLYIVVALVIIGVAALVYYQFVRQSTDLADLSGVARETVTNDSVGLSFSYIPGEHGFSLAEPPAGEDGLLAAYVLVPTKEYEAFKASTDPREAPASITMLVYSLDTATNTATSGERIDRITRLQNWAIDNSTLTSFNQAKATPDIIEVDGIKALHYQADGLYQQDIYLVSYKNRAYMLTGQYNDPSDITFTAFQELIGTVSLE